MTIVIRDRSPLPKPVPPRAAHGPRREQRPARPIAYRGSRSVPPLRMTGRAGVIRARLDPRRSTRRTGHLQRRVLRRPAHAIVAIISSLSTVVPASAGEAGVWPRAYGPRRLL